jgi:hypothetical protein
MASDMECLIVAGYLYSRQVFSEIVISSKPDGVQNSFEAESGKLMEGVDQFVIYSANIYALTFDLVILVPAFLEQSGLSCLSVQLSSMGKAQTADLAGAPSRCPPRICFACRAE